MSACLLGLDCTFTGRPNKAWETHFSGIFPLAGEAGIEFFPICPEQLGGMPTPRPKSELITPADRILFQDGKVMNECGEDVTACFLKGAWETLRIAKILRVRIGVMKARSPSCGLDMIYSGTFDGVLIPGQGLTTALLKHHGFKIFSEETFCEAWKLECNFGFLDSPK